MRIYAWTVKVHGRPDIKHVTTLDELRDYLRGMDLPGVAPPEFATHGAEVHDHGTYTHNAGSMDEWKADVDED